MSDFSHHTSECRCPQCVRDLDAQLEIRRLREALDKVVAAKHRAFEENRDLRARLKAVRELLEFQVGCSDRTFSRWPRMARVTDLRVRKWKADR